MTNFSMASSIGAFTLPIAATMVGSKLNARNRLCRGGQANKAWQIFDYYDKTGISCYYNNRGITCKMALTKHQFDLLVSPRGMIGAGECFRA